MSSLTVQSISKINLALEIRGLLPDGRHELLTWFQAIDYGDTISGRVSEKISLTCNLPDLCPPEKNLAWIAASLLQQQYGQPGQGVALHLEKQVPFGAGLGGGSGDAAAVLHLCNRLWNLNLPTHALEELAKQIGADVPFLVRGGGAWATGAGDILESSAALPSNIAVLVATPNVEVPTGWAYKSWDELAQEPLPKATSVTKLHSLFARNPFSLEDLSGCLYNSFEDVVYPRFPEIAKLHDDMETLGAAATLLSGSGSSVFGLFRDTSVSEETLHEWTQRGIRWRWCRSVAENQI